ncbi:DUF4136 domain-containing protein [Congregibacter sp.]|uniref:DUF4136 domain-containing protein n=1 Tax=Congregibacter sp. TaxID=2744308 RepID=UPI003F6C7EFA
MTRTFLAIFVVLAIAGCSSNPPVIDYDSSIDFSGYRTYAFISDHPLMRAEGAPPISPLLEGRLMRITEDSLNAKGFRIVANPEEADFAIGYTSGSRDKIKVNSYPEPYRPYYGGWGWGGSYYGGAYGGGSNVDVQQYTEGTLAIDIYDVTEHKPAWHGVATKRITDDMRRNPGEALTEIVNEILAGFPPGSMAQ